MGDFKREERYIVIKIKDLKDSQEQGMRNLLALNDIPTRECVVVEPDWPIYEETWENVQRLAEGRPSFKECWEEEQRGEAEIRDVLEGTKEERDALAEQLQDERRNVYEANAERRKMMEERDALAAHFERFEKEARRHPTHTDYTRTDDFVHWHNDTPATSLARLKDKWQAEALEALFARTYYMDSGTDIRADLTREIKRLRAEGGK